MATVVPMTATTQASDPWGKFWMPVIDWLFAWQGPEHCRRAFEEDRARLQFPIELR